MLNRTYRPFHSLRLLIPQMGDGPTLSQVWSVLEHINAQPLMDRPTSSGLELNLLDGNGNAYVLGKVCLCCFFSILLLSPRAPPPVATENVTLLDLYS